MTDDPPDTSTTEIWHLRLYVAGESSRSLRAFSNLKTLCEEHLRGRYEIEVIDLAQDPSLAATDDIVALPTLVRRLPEPLRRVIGDLSDTERVLVNLRVNPVAENSFEPGRDDSRAQR